MRSKEPPHDRCQSVAIFAHLAARPADHFPCSCNEILQMQRSNPLSGHTAIPSDALGKCLPSGRATCTTLSGRPQHRRSPASPLLLCTFLHASTSFSLSYFATPAIVHCSSRRWSGDSHVDLRRSLETDYLSSEPVPASSRFPSPYRRAPSRQYVTTTTPVSLSSNHVSSRRPPAPAIQSR